jgi:hypothetical protein
MFAGEFVELIWLAAVKAPWDACGGLFDDEGVGNWNREGLGCACGIVPEEEPLFPSAVY